MELDYSQMTYDLSKVGPDEFIIDVFPELKDYPEFSDQHDNELLKWVMLLCDMGSPFFKPHKNFYKRGRAVFEHMNMGEATQEFELSAYIKGELERGQDWFRVKVQAMIYKYFIIIDESSYMTWLSLFTSFHELQAFSQMSLDMSDPKYEDKFAKKENVLKLLPAKQKQLAEYERIVFGDSKIKEIVVKQEAKIITWPERMALIDE